jgi:hypothetical protein
MGFSTQPCSLKAWPSGSLLGSSLPHKPPTPPALPNRNSVIKVSSFAMGLTRNKWVQGWGLACLRTSEVFPIKLGVFNESFTSAKRLNQRLTGVTGSPESWQQMREAGAPALLSPGARLGITAAAEPRPALSPAAERLINKLISTHCATVPWRALFIFLRVPWRSTWKIASTHHAL